MNRTNESIEKPFWEVTRDDLAVNPEWIMPWCQQPGEEDDEYQRYLCYQSCGPARTLRGSYRVWVAESEETPRVDISRNVNPSWRRLARQWHWEERAQAYDREQFLARGAKVASLWIEVAVSSLQQLLRTARRCAPKNSEQWRLQQEGLSRIITPELLAGVMSRVEKAE